MIQKASKKVLLGRVQAAVSGYGQLYRVPAKAHSVDSPDPRRSPGSRPKNTTKQKSASGTSRWRQL